MANQTNNNSKDIKEVTLYNFATIRDPEYVNKEALKENLNFICFDLGDVHLQKSSDEKPYNKKTFLNFEKLKKPVKQEEKISISDDKNPEYILNSFFDRILYLYKSKSDDFYEINNLLLGKDQTNNIEVHLKKEKELQKKIWLSFVYNLKHGNNFKEKEIATNLLRYFHLKKYRHLIDDESKEEKFENFHKLINAQIVIPEELFPKSETFFYGERYKLDDENLEYLKLLHSLNVIYLRKELETLDQYQSKLLEANIKELEDRIDSLKTKLDDFNDTNTSLYYSSVNFIENKAYFLLSTNVINDNFNKDEIESTTLKIEFQKIEGEKVIPEEVLFQFPLNPLEQQTGFSNFDAYFELHSKEKHNLIPKPESDKSIVYKFSLEIKLRSGKEHTINNKLVWKEKEFLRYEAKGYFNDEDYYGKAFKPSGYGVQMLGIADYRKVVSTISRYIPAEVAHIENLMSGEFREKVTTKETSTEITEFESTESETEKLNETTTNDRFQMQNEVARILNEQRTNNVTANAGYSNGGFYANLSTGNSATNSKEESNKQAVIEAQEITNKAVEKIVSKVKKERTTKITEKFIDVNKYGFDNRGNKDHVSGVYRHINAVYRNRIHNYGKRLTFEFSIPEPAFIYKNGKNIVEEDSLLNDIINLPKPTNPLELFPSYKEVTQKNIEGLIIEFKLEKPKEFISEFTFKKEGAISGIGKKLFFQKSEVDSSLYTPKEGIQYQLIDYFPTDWSINGWVEYKGHSDSHVNLYIDEQKITFNHMEGSANDKVKIEKINQKFLTGNTLTEIELIRNIESASIYDFSISFKLKDEILEKWQREQYDIIIKAYEERKNKYNEEVDKIITAYKAKKIEDKKALIESERNNLKQAIQFRQIEINTLKRNCLSYLIDEETLENKVRKFGINLIENRDFKDFKIRKNHELDEYTAFVRFLEQAFEWESMSYNFYPYYWGDLDTWKENYNEDNDDPLYKAFLQAGMARVIVTVRPKFEDAVNMYMTTGKIWMGGNLPVYGSSLFVSIADELKNNEEYTVEDEWESVLPTNLVAIQSSGAAIIQEGLPNLLENKHLGQIKNNDAKIKRKKFLGLF